MRKYILKCTKTGKEWKDDQPEQEDKILSG